MSRRCSHERKFPLLAGVTAAAALLAVAGVGAAADGPAVATSESPAGALLRRPAGGAWQAVAPQAAISAGETLIALPLSDARLTAKNGAVRVDLVGNLPQLSPFPVLESAVVLQGPKGTDLDLTLLRGRVVLVNTRKEGAATVRVPLPRGEWMVTLGEPGAAVALEMFGRWPRGVPFSTDPASTDAPTQDLVLLILKGSAEVKVGGTTFGLSAPPGPAYYHWDSFAGSDPGPQRRTELPEWRTKDAASTPEGKAALAVLADLAKRFAAGGRPEEATRNLMKEADTARDPLRAGAMRRGAVYAMAAVDQLDGLVQALGHKQADVRDTAVQALRHWIGRGPGQDLKLYAFLQKEKKFPPAHAETVLDLLHTPSEDDLARPETYEAIIAFLRHPQVAVRQLAAWHLHRLLPAEKGQEIQYDPTGPEESWARAAAAWKKRIATRKP